TIALTAWGMAKFYGFRTTLSEKQTKLQNFVVFAVFIALAVPLTLSLRQIVWEANAARQVRGTLSDTFGPSSRVSQPEIEFDRDPLRVSAFVWTTALREDAEVRAEASLERLLGEPVDIELKQFLVRDERSAVSAQIASAKAQEEAAARDRVDNLAQRLSLAAGVPDSEVIIDDQRRRAWVRAKALPGAGLETYYALEQRIAASEPEWRVELVPPVDDLPATIPFIEGTPDIERLELVGWTANRLGRRVRLTGPDEQTAKLAQDLSAEGVAAVTANGTGTVRVDWAD
ncbi:MAG: DUF389 domain-containing protein, partial [Sphingomonadaceae bacterium]|nr:DUF389 domain-containing protein [Sphingomonadaceae bacterium]